MTELAQILPLDIEYTTELWAAQYEATLALIPPLIEFMRESVYALSAAAVTERVSGGGFKAGVPFRGGDDERFLIDQADDLWSQLVIYARDVADRLKAPAPAALGKTWTGRNDAIGLRADADPLTARHLAYQVTDWLIRHSPAVAGLHDSSNGIEETERILFDTVRRYGGQYGFHPRVRWVAAPLCRVCGECRLVIDWTTNEAGTVTGLGVCAICGQTYATTSEESPDV